MVSNITLPNKTDQQNISTVGSILKATRIKNGITVEEVSQKTYIKIHYLKALEDEHYELLPAPVYTTGYIRQYAKLLGLDSTQLVSQYQQQYQKVNHYQSNDVVDNTVNSPRKVETSKQTTITVLDEITIQTPPARQPEQAVSEEINIEPSSPPQPVSIPTGPAINAAESKANQILEDARSQANQFKSSAEQYADDLLSSLEDEIKKTLSIIHNGRTYLKQRLKNYEDSFEKVN